MSGLDHPSARRAWTQPPALGVVFRGCPGRSHSPWRPLSSCSRLGPAMRRRVRTATCSPRSGARTAAARDRPIRGRPPMCRRPSCSACTTTRVRRGGRARLTVASELATSSGRKAIDLRECSYSQRNSDSHNCGPGDVFYRVREAGYCYRSVGENVYWGWASSDGSTPSPRQAMDWWLNSDGHRNSLLSSSFTQAGFGLAKGQLTGVSSPYGRSWVAHFGRPCS